MGKASIDELSTKYHFDEFIKANLTDRGKVKKGSILDFDGIDVFDLTLWCGVFNGIGATYSWTIDIIKANERETKTGRKRREYGSLVLNVSQNGVSIIKSEPPWEPNEVYAIVKRIDLGMQDYAFIPVAYELWSDNPDIPYYIEKMPSLCETTVLISNGGLNG